MTQSGHSTLDTYNFIVDWAMKHKGNTPTQRQVANACGFSHASAQYHIGKLIASGHLERIDNELCIAHGEFIVKDGAWAQGQPERHYPEIELMSVIPKDIRWEGRRGDLAQWGIVIGSNFDEQFSHAAYPPGWSYVAQETPVPSWFLADSEGVWRGALRFDKENYAAALYIW